MSFYGVTDTPVLDFWWCLLWVSKPECAALFALGGGVCDVHSLKFTSGATLASLLMVSMVASHCSSHASFSKRGMPGDLPHSKKDNHPVMLLKQTQTQTSNESRDIPNLSLQNKSRQMTAEGGTDPMFDPLWICYCKPSKFKLHYKVLSIHVSCVIQDKRILSVCLSVCLSVSLSLSLSLLYFRQTVRQIENGYKCHGKPGSLKLVRVLVPFPLICSPNSVVLLCANFMLNKFGS